MSNSLHKIKGNVAKMEEAKQEAPKIEEKVGPGTPFGVSVDPGGVTVFVEFYPDRHCVKVDFDRKKTKTWDMVIGYLHMAILQAETQRELTIAANMQRQQAQRDEEQLVKLGMLQNQEGRRVLQH